MVLINSSELFLFSGKTGITFCFRRDLNIKNNAAVAKAVYQAQASGGWLRIYESGPTEFKPRSILPSRFLRSRLRAIPKGNRLERSQ